MLIRRGPVAAAVPAVAPDGAGAARTQAEVAPAVAGHQVAVEPAVGEIAADPGGNAEPAAVDRAAGNPERIVLDVAQVVGGDPADPARLVTEQGEIELGRNARRPPALDPAESIERIAQDADRPVRVSS